MTYQFNARSGFKRIFLGVIFMTFASAGFNINRLISVFTDFYMGIFIILIVLWPLRNRRIVITEKEIILYKFMKKPLVLALNRISKIELFSERGWNLEYDIMSIYIDGRIFDYPITAYKKTDLIKALIQIASVNHIELDMVKLKSNTFNFAE